MEDLVQKLSSSIEEIQKRALDNIHDKVRYGLADIDVLVTQTEICQILVKWLEDKVKTENVTCKSILVSQTKVLTLLKVLAQDSSHAHRMLASLNLGQVLEEWNVKYGSVQDELTIKLTRDLQSFFANHPDDSQDESSALLTSYGATADLSSSLVQPPIEFLHQRNLSLPPHLFQATNPSSVKKRNYSPVSRQYIKKVTFDSGRDESALEVEEESAYQQQMASVFHWHAISRLDRDHLAAVHSSLTSFKPEVIRDACVEFQGDVINDFPAEVFLQRPDIVFALQDLLLTNSNQALRSLSAQALAKLCTSLTHRWAFCSKVKSARQDSILQLMSTNGQDIHQDGLEEDSFADPINTTQLKRRQLEPYEFALMILSNAAQAWQVESSNMNMLRSANANYELFQAVMAFIDLIFPQDLSLYKDVEESINEVESEMLKSLVIFQRLGGQQGRSAFLLVLKAAIVLTKKINDLSSNLACFIQSVAWNDPTLYLSHQHLHEQLGIETEAFKETTHKALQSIKYSIKVMLDTHPVPKLKDLQLALPALTLHENFRLWIPLIMQVARTVRDLEEAGVASKMILKLLNSSSSQVRSEALFQLHNVVQDILGVAQALDLNGTTKLDLTFLILDEGGRLFAKCLAIVLSEDKDAEEMMKKAASEIVLYLLKSEKVLGKKMWKMLEKKVIQPNLILIECCIHDEPLFAWLKKRYADENDHTVQASLEGNLRLLLTSKSESARREAQGCLRTLLSRQPNSATKLPRFSSIVAQDLTQVKGEERLALNTRTAKDNIDVSTEDIKTLLDVLHSPPDYDILSRQTALEQLLTYLENYPGTHKDFLDTNGVEKVTLLLDKCLDEQFNYWLTLYASAIQVLKTVLTHQFSKIKPDEEVQKLLYYTLTRGLFVFSSTPQVLNDIIVVLSLLLYAPCLGTSGSHLTLPSEMLRTINFPIEAVEAATTTVVTDNFLAHTDGQTLLYKVYWNLAWFGGIHILYQWEDAKGDHRFSPKLVLSKEELLLVQESFSEAIIEDIILRLTKFKTHQELSEALHKVNLHLNLLEDNVEKYDWILTLPWLKGLSRFLRITPNTRNDEKLFLLITELLTKMRPTEEILMSILREGCENLMEFLCRDQPRKMGIDLLIRGHHKVGQFLLDCCSNEQPTCLKDKFQNKVTQYEFNYWSLQIKAQMKLIAPKQISRLVKIISQHSPTLFRGRGQVIQALMILDQAILEDQTTCLKSFQFTDMSWLRKTWRNRCSVVRTLGYQIASSLATTDQGANLLLDKQSDCTVLWKSFIEVVQENGESSYVKTSALNTLYNLLVLGSMKGAHWYGPIVHEKISGLKLVGMASLRPFLQGINFEEVIVRLFLAFDYHHSSQHSESTMTEESVRLNSLASTLNSNSIFEIDKDFSILEQNGNNPTTQLIAGVLRFLRLIINQDNSTEEKYGSLVKLETSTFPIALKLLSNHQNLRLEDQCLLHALTDFIMICVVNYSWAVAMLLEEDKCLCLSMLVTTYHRLLISPDKLLELFALLLIKVDSKPSISNEMLRLVDKYRIALLEMESRCASDGNGTNFCTALSRFLVNDNNRNQSRIIDLWDPKVVQMLSKSLIVSRNNRALKHLMIISHLTQEAVMEEQSLVTEAVQMLEKPKLTNESLSFLNNFCYSNLGGQILLVQDLAIHRKLVPVAVKLCNQLLIDVKRRDLMVTITNLLSFLTTLTADCPAAKALLPFNVWVDKGKSSSLMQLLIDLLSNDNLGDNLIRTKVWIPYSFRIITASLTSVECRSWLIRTPKFLNRQCSRDIDGDATEVSEVFWLDLLLSLTTYSDGQMWLAKSNELVDQLVDKAHASLPALAILRNLSFHPSGRAKLLLLPNYLGLLPSCLVQKQDEVRARLALTSIWALAANCHKAKMVLNKSLLDLDFHVFTNLSSLSAKVLNVLSIE